MNGLLARARTDEEMLVRGRAQNVRQLLIRGLRVVNVRVVERLEQAGYADVRLSHGALLANLDRTGNTITAVAERAGMTKQSMGSLARELEERGYIRRTRDPDDNRAKRLVFTRRGWRMMLATFAAIEAVEQSYRARLGDAAVDALLASLAALVVAEGELAAPLR